MKDKISIALATLLFIFIAIGVYLNVSEQQAIDQSKLSDKVESSRGFQRWITNLKNKDFEINADEFRLVEENEIYNTRWMTVYSLDEEGIQETFDETLKEHQDIKKVIFSPSEREFLDYREEERGISPNGEPFQTNEVRFYGKKEDKVIDARILDCSLRANCYFDRAWFIDNDVFVVSEFSRNIHKKDETSPICNMNETCTYTVKLHVIDLINNSRLVYESETMDLVFSNVKHEL
jgi:hypothetical protein